LPSRREQGRASPTPTRFQSSVIPSFGPNASLALRRGLAARAALLRPVGVSLAVAERSWPATQALRQMTLRGRGKRREAVPPNDIKSEMPKTLPPLPSCRMASMATHMLQNGCAVSFATIESSIQSLVRSLASADSERFGRSTPLRSRLTRGARLSATCYFLSSRYLARRESGLYPAAGGQNLLFSVSCAVP
jgi:hypothetical protein